MEKIFVREILELIGFYVWLDQIKAVNAEYSTMGYSYDERTQMMCIIWDDFPLKKRLINNRFHGKIYHVINNRAIPNYDCDSDDDYDPLSYRLVASLPQNY